jgi:hypothetical protein
MEEGNNISARAWKVEFGNNIFCTSSYEDAMFEMEKEAAVVNLDANSEGNGVQ